MSEGKYLTKNKTNNSHLVPNFILKNFCNDPDGSAKYSNFTGLNKADNYKYFSLSTKKASVRKKFYHDSLGLLSLESYIEEIESKSISSIIKLITSRNIFSLSVFERDAISNFILLQISRTSLSRDISRATFREIEERLREFVSDGVVVGIDNDNYEHDMLITAIISANNEWNRKSFSKRSMFLIEPPKGRFFTISDNGFSILKSNSLDLSSNLISYDEYKNTYVFPITESLSLVSIPEGLEHRESIFYGCSSESNCMTISESDLELLNARQMLFSSSCLYSKDEKELTATREKYEAVFRRNSKSSYEIDWS